MTKLKKSIAALDPQARADKGREIEIMVDGEGTGMFLSIVGKESSAYKAETRRRINEARKDEISRGDKPVPFRSIEDDIAAEIEILAGLTTGWRGVVIEEAEGELPFTPENVRRLYAYDFVRRQVDTAVMEQSDFTPG